MVVGHTQLETPHDAGVVQPVGDLVFLQETFERLVTPDSLRTDGVTLITSSAPPSRFGELQLRD